VSAAPEVLPMFPLGSVLLPGMALPLRVFEPRYRQMMAEVLSSDPPRFGVVLIERGSEVGGGDVRTDVGCVAVVKAVEEAPDGTLALLAVGEERVTVREWLPDDPYPRARVERWGEPEEARSASGDLDALAEEVLEVTALALRLLGEDPPPRVQLAEDPVRRCFELATLAPLGPLDRQRILCAPGLGARTTLLWELVGEQRLLLEARARFEDG
jgi:Lon protease-like protein